MNLILISSPEEEKKELEKTIELFKNGLTKFHLKKTQWSMEEYSRFIENIPSIYHSHIVLHQYHELATQYNLGGIHYTEKTRPSFQDSDLPCSTSFHELAQLTHDWGKYEYAFLSPIFDSISKVGYKAHFKKNQLEETLKNTNYKIAALGGITPDQIPTCKALGFDGAAVLGYVWASENPIRAFQELMKACH